MTRYPLRMMAPVLLHPARDARNTAGRGQNGFADRGIDAAYTPLPPLMAERDRGAAPIGDAEPAAFRGESSLQRAEADPAVAHGPCLGLGVEHGPAQRRVHAFLDHELALEIDRPARR